MNSRVRKGLLTAVLVAAVGVLAVDYGRDGPPQRGQAASSPGVEDGKPAGAAPATPGKESPLLALPERTPLGEPSGELFPSNSWQPPAPKSAPAPPPAPVAPPLPYRFAGKFVHGAEHSVMLSKDDLVFPVKVGETLDGAYRVESIEETQITLIYLPLKQKQRIVVSSWLPPPSESKTAGPAPSRAIQPVPPTASAQPSPPPTASVASGLPGGAATSIGAPATAQAILSWRAPDTIKVGQDVKVELVVKTDGALRSLPLQVSFDPGVLQFVEVQEGAFFKQGGQQTSFAHNVDQANGRLFVGITRSGTEGARGEDGLIAIVFRAKAQNPRSELRVLAATAVGVGPNAVTVGLPQPRLLSVVQ